MTHETLLALMAFAFVSSITPGPNNLMLMTSGANFGFRRTVPHMLGVGIGFMFMLLIVGMGLMHVFDRYPAVFSVLRIASMLYLLYLAWNIATAAPVGAADNDSTGKPLTFLQAAAFQWVNPKAWAMSLTAISVYATDESLGQVIMVTLAFGLVNLPCVSSWAALGQQIHRVLNKPLRLRVFNTAMAVLLVASMLPTLLN
ncbi:MAG: LysE family translocator [Pseudomonadota bacterium]